MNRTQALCIALGWQGGTIHQVAAETGCSVESLLDPRTPDSEDYQVGKSNGMCYPRLSPLVFIVSAPVRFTIDYWLGVADGIIEAQSQTQ